MARIAGVDIPNDKRVVVSLTYIYGIGRPTAEKVLEEVNVDENIRVKDLSEEQLNAIRKAIDAIKVEGDLRREVQLNIKRLMEIGCYRGIRHRKGLPVRGQRTKTNARTRKGKAKTVATRRSKKGEYKDMAKVQKTRKTSCKEEYSTRMCTHPLNFQ